MKNYYLFLLCFCLQQAFSQVCTPNNAYNYSGFYPQDSLSPICKNNDYEALITWVIPKDTFFNNIASQIDSVQLWNVINLPTGINYSASNDHYLGGTKGCIQLTGIPNDTGYFYLQAVCQWFYYQNGNPFAKIDTVALPILHIYPALTTQIIAISDPHCGEYDGTAVLYGHGAFPPFTYSWDNGQVGTVATNLAGGIHNVLIESVIGCTIEESIALETLGNVINANLQSQNASCANENDGQITVFPYGSATPPFRFEWSNGDTTAHIDNLSPGFYEVVVIDSNQCAAVYTSTINAPSELFIEANISPDTMLLGVGEITVQASGGLPPYTYSWSNGNANPSNTGLIAGNYSIWLIDSNGCLAWKTYPLFSVSLLANEPVFMSESIVLYPNPNSGYFYLKGNFSPQENIHIYDMMLHEIPFVSTYSDNLWIATQGIATGLYMLKIGEKSQVFRVW